MRVTIPNMKLVSLANAREHWTKRKRRSNAEAELANGYMFRGFCTGEFGKPAGSVIVTLVRHYTGRCKLMDDDNLAGAFKAIRDAVAKWLNRDDADPTIRWEYRQERSDDNAVTVEIRTGSPGSQESK